jgi:hypothetical protein
MSKENNITLSICGNADSNSGYQQLVAIEPAFYPEDKVYSAVMMNESYYTLQNRTDVTVIIKTINNVSSYGQTREGRLRIGISIPAGLCISSPKSLIDEIEAAFKANYMTQGLKWQFKRAEYDLNIFRSILQKYPLFPSPTVHRPMTTGGDVAYVFTSNITELLFDYQYKEFQPYGEIVIAEKGSAATGVINSLAIPRQPIYDVHILRNGKPLEPVDPISDSSKILDFAVLPEDQSVYQPVSVKFSIDELKGMLSGDKDCEWGQISLDEKQEAVAIKVQSFPEKVFDCRLVVTDENIDMSKIELSNGRFIKAVSATGNFQLKGREIYNMWSVKYPSDWSLTFSPSELNFQGQLAQSINVSKPKPIAPKVVDPYMPGIKDSKPADANYDLYTVEATIVNPQGVDKDFFANIFLTQYEGGWEYARKITLSKVSEERYDKNIYCAYKGEVPMPKDIVGLGENSFSVRATIPSLNIHFIKDNVQLRKNSTIELGEDKPGNGIKKSMPLLYAILLALGMLLIGGAAGWGITHWLTSSSKETPAQPAPPQSSQVLPTPPQSNPDQPKTDQPSTPSDPASQVVESSQVDAFSSANTQKDIAADYDKKLARIKTLDFKFSEIAGLKQFLDNQEAKVIDKNRPDKNRLSYHVKVAEEVFKAISLANSTAETIKKAVGSYAATSNTNLDQKIRAAICASYSGDYRDANKKAPYSRNQSKIAVEAARSCKSYQDLYNIPNKVLSNNDD